MGEVIFAAFDKEMKPAINKALSSNGTRTKALLGALEKIEGIYKKDCGGCLAKASIARAALEGWRK